MTINEIQDKIIEEFSILDDWLDKYEYIIKSGKELDPLQETLKTEENSVKGCQSRVWIGAELKGNELCFFADSDALITKGLIALVLRVLNNQTPDVIANTELYFIDKIGLSSNLSPSRANGLASIVKHIKWHAQSHLIPIQ
jgi:cysteine desulfuration protein SufE